MKAKKRHVIEKIYDKFLDWKVEGIKFDARQRYPALRYELFTGTLPSYRCWGGE